MIEPRLGGLESVALFELGERRVRKRPHALVGRRQAAAEDDYGDGTTAAAMPRCHTRPGMPSSLVRDAPLPAPEASYVRLTEEHQDATHEIQVQDTDSVVHCVGSDR